MDDGFPLRFVGLAKQISTPLEVTVPTSPVPDVVDIDDLEDHSPSEREVAHIQTQRWCARIPSELIPGAKRNTAARDTKRAAAKITSFHSHPIKLEGVIEERYGVVWALLTPEVEAVKYVLVPAINPFR